MKTITIANAIICLLLMLTVSCYANKTELNLGDSFSYWNKSDSTVFENIYEQIFEIGETDLDLAFELIDQIKCDSLQINPMQRGRLYYTEARFNRNTQQFNKAIELCEKAMASFKMSNEDVTGRIGNCYMQMGNCFFHLGEFDKGIATSLQGFEFVEHTDLNTLKSGLLITIGLMYSGLQDLESAEMHYLRALDFTNLGDKSYVFYIQNNLGHIYEQSEQFDKSNVYYKKALNTAIEKDNFYSQMMACVNLANLNNTLEKYEIALEFIEIGKSIKKQTNNDYVWSHLIFTEAKILLQTCPEKINTQELKNILDKAERDATLNLSTIVAELLKDYYFKIEDYKEALVYSEKHKLMEDELNSVDKSIKSATIIADNKHKKQLAFITSKKDRIILSSLIIGCILFLIGFTYYLQFKNQKNKTSEIETLLDEEKNSNQTVVDKLSSVYQLKLQRFKFTFSDLIYENISKQLHDDVASSIAGIKYGLSGLQIADREPMIAYSIKHLNNVYSTVRNLSHTVSPLDDSKNDFSEVVKEYFMMTSEIPIKVDFSGKKEEALISTNIKSELFRILKELVLNANKHSGASQIKIEVKLNDVHIYASVHDNGKGIYTDGLGKGLSNIRNRVHHLNGVFRLEKLNGTRATVFIPLAGSMA